MAGGAVDGTLQAAGWTVSNFVFSHELIPVDNQQEINYDALFKVIVIGDHGVGKSCILARLIDNAFNDQHNVTIGVEFGNYVMRIDN